MGAGLMQRQTGWENRLAEAMAVQQQLHFEWGKSDCAHLMGAAIRASQPKHGVLKELKRYTTKRGAILVMKREGGLASILARHLPEIGKLMAQQGDVGVVIRDGIEAGCVVVDGMAVGKSETGLFRVPILTLEKAFRV